MITRAENDAVMRNAFPGKTQGAKARREEA